VAETHSEVAAPSPAQDAGGHGGGHHGFDWDALNQSHNYPYPALEWLHGSPLLIFNVPEYAKLNFSVLKSDAAFSTVEPSEALVGKAKAYIAKQDGWHGPDETQLAKAMVVAESKAGAVFPEALSFVNHQIFWSTIALSIMALLLLVICRRRPDQHKPANRFQHMMEAVVLYVRDEIVKPNLHHAGNGWTAFFASLFLALLTCNLFGLVPLFATATGSLGVTSSWAVIIGILMVGMGMKANGPVHFWVSIVPWKWSWNPGSMLLWVFLFVNEVISIISRPIILAIRLFANMFAGHIVLLVFVSLGFIVYASSPQSDNVPMSSIMGVFGGVMTIALYALELLVAVLQAYIFTLLSAVFIGLCVHPEH
jgi:F-type H+-transporting ATPase subunit a